MGNFDHVVIAGSGPVGSFMAVLCKSLGFRVTVYEKRETPSRNINLKIDADFFKEVQKMLSKLKVKSMFFINLNDYLETKDNKITIKELEQRFIGEAKSRGAKFIIEDVKSFRQLYTRHKNSNPIILDCAGRKSNLRIKEFGDDQDNMVIFPLQHAMYINFKAKVNDNLSLYQVMKYVKDIKLAEIVVSKEKSSIGFTDVTIPAFITSELARVFDRECPNTNKEPFNPFNDPSGRSSDRIFFAISSICGNLIVDGWSIDLDSIRVKKIDIECGYAKTRSYDSYVCMGDSAVHLAFFKSLNLGLKHALILFQKLSMFYGKNDLEDYRVDDIMTQFQRDNPQLNPVEVYYTEARNVVLVVTRVIRYGCHSYNLITNRTESLTNIMGISKNKIADVLNELNHKVSMWKNSLEEFEAKRDEDIKNYIQDNEAKNVLYNHLSWLTNLNGKSIIKISELVRVVGGKYALTQKDFDFIFECLKSSVEAGKTSKGNDIHLTTINNLVNQLKCEMSFAVYQLKKICRRNDISNDEKVILISNFVNSESIRQEMRSNNLDASSNFILSFIRNELEQIQETYKVDEELAMLLPDLIMDDVSIEDDKSFTFVNNSKYLAPRSCKNLKKNTKK